jgi:hypothetical protein
MYNILTEIGTLMKLITLIIMCLNETYSKVRISENLSDAFPIQNGLKQGDALSPLLLTFAIEYTIRKVQEYEEELESDGIYQQLIYVDNINILGQNMKTIKKITEALLQASTVVGL